MQDYKSIIKTALVINVIVLFGMIIVAFVKVDKLGIQAFAAPLCLLQSLITLSYIYSFVENLQNDLQKKQDQLDKLQASFIQFVQKDMPKESTPVDPQKKYENMTYEQIAALENNQKK